MVLCLKTWKSRTLPGYYPYAYIYHRYCRFLGSNLAEFYLNKGFKVSGNDNLVGGELDNLDLNRINFYQIDCENLNELSKAMKGVDVVCHTAAYAHEGLSSFSPTLICSNNVTGSTSVFTAAIKIKFEDCLLFFYGQIWEHLNTI